MFLKNTFRAFRHRDYLIFWCGLFLGHTGTLVQATAQSWLIFELTDSPFYLGLDGLCLGLPRVLFSPLGGAIVDRMNRRLLFIVTQTGFLLTTVSLGLLNHLGIIQVSHLLIASAITGLLVSFEQPVRQSVLHDLVPRSELPNAVALYQMVFNGSALFGPSIGGMMIPLVDTEGCFFTAAAGNFLVLVSIFKIHIGATPLPSRSRSLTREMLNGLAAAWRTPTFFSLLTILTVVTLCTKPYTQFMPVFARDILVVGAPGLGLLLMAPGAGAIFGGLTLASVTRFPKPHRLLLFLAAGFGVSIVLFAASRIFAVSLICLFLAGAFQTTFLSSTATLLQLHTDETNRARIMSLFGLINRGVGPMGTFPFGLLATRIGAPLTVAICGFLATALIAYLLLYRRQLRDINPIIAT